MNNRIETHSTQNTHMQGTANVFSAAADMGLSCVTPGAIIIGGNTDQGGDLLTVELSQFRQLGQENSAGLGAYTVEALQNFVSLAEVVIELDMLLYDLVEFSDLSVEGSEHLLNAFSNPWMSNCLASIEFLCTQVNELAAATDEIGQFVGFGADRRFRLGLDDLSEAGKHACIDGVGLGEFADSTCKITDLAWGGDNDLEVGLQEAGDYGPFVSAGCLEDDQGNTMRLKGLDKLVDAWRGVGHRDIDGGRTRGDVKCVFGNVDTNE